MPQRSGSPPTASRRIWSRQDPRWTGLQVGLTSHSTWGTLRVNFISMLRMQSTVESGTATLELEPR